MSIPSGLELFVSALALISIITLPGVLLTFGFIFWGAYREWAVVPLMFGVGIITTAWGIGVALGLIIIGPRLVAQT